MNNLFYNNDMMNQKILWNYERRKDPSDRVISFHIY